MTLERWLHEATAGLPPEVVQRVQAEYAAHVAESGLPEAEAVAALGQPGRVRRALGRTYLGEERLRTLRDGAGVPMVAAVVWVMPPLYALFLAWNYAAAAPFPWWRLLAPALSLGLTALLWHLTRRLPAERRVLWRSTVGGLSLQFMLWFQWVLQTWHGEPFVWPWGLPVFGGMLLGLVCWTAWDDRRLRRTLALKEGRP